MSSFKKFGGLGKGLQGRPGDGAPPAVRQAHENAKVEVFNELADTAERLGLHREAQKRRNNRDMLDRRHPTTGSAPQTKPEPAPEPFVRILMDGIGEKINVVA